MNLYKEQRSSNAFAMVLIPAHTFVVDRAEKSIPWGEGMP